MFLKTNEEICVKNNPLKFLLNLFSLNKHIYSFFTFFFRHYEVPNLPSIPGREVFTGLQIHSHDYRKPEIFKDMTVVVIGAGPSGLDIGLDLTSSAKHVSEI